MKELEKGKLKLMEAILNEDTTTTKTSSSSRRRLFSDIQIVNLSGESTRGRCNINFSLLHSKVFIPCKFLPIFQYVGKVIYS